jgi:hypothetical protein
MAAPIEAGSASTPMELNAVMPLMNFGELAYAYENPNWLLPAMVLLTMVGEPETQYIPELFPVTRQLVTCAAAAQTIPGPELAETMLSKTVGEPASALIPAPPPRTVKPSMVPELGQMTAAAELPALVASITVTFAAGSLNDLEGSVPMNPP